jgi:phosphoserine phosphatase
MDIRYLVLDLDNTLIYAQPVAEAGKLSEGQFAFRVLPNRNMYKTVVRRHTKEFLKVMIAKGYKLIVWSAGSEYYVKCIVTELFSDIEFEYVMTYNHLTDQKKIMSTISEHVKGINIDQVRLLDDNRIHESDQHKHFVYITPFKGEQDDALLQAIMNIDNSYQT